MSELSPKAIEKRREYKRNWYARNKEKAKEYNDRHWERAAAASEESASKDEVRP